MQRDRKLVVPWVRLEIGFYSLFLLPESGDASLGRRSVSLVKYHLLGTHGPPAVCPSLGKASVVSRNKSKPTVFRKVTSERINVI
jgi:hypothetical protein